MSATCQPFWRRRETSHTRKQARHADCDKPAPRQRGRSPELPDPAFAGGKDRPLLRFGTRSDGNHKILHSASCRRRGLRSSHSTFKEIDDPGAECGAESAERRIPGCPFGRVLACHPETLNSRALGILVPDSLQDRDSDIANVPPVTVISQHASPRIASRRKIGSPVSPAARRAKSASTLHIPNGKLPSSRSVNARNTRRNPAGSRSGTVPVTGGRPPRVRPGRRRGPAPRLVSMMS